MKQLSRGPRKPQRRNENVQRRKNRRCVSLKSFVRPAPEFDLKEVLPEFECRRKVHQENNKRIKSLEKWLASGTLVQTNAGELGKARFPGSVHGEYDPTFDVFQLHLHVLAIGEKAVACERIRKLKAYVPNENVRRPVYVESCKCRPRQVSYHTAQGFWLSKPTVLVDGHDTRTRDGVRIPEPRHSEMLMWLDRQSFADLLWLHGCILKNGRLVPNENSRTGT